MNNRGFTLIEMLVAIAIFLVVSVAALGALLVMTASSQKVQATRTVVDNIGFIVDDIVRESRLAVNHWCGDISGSLPTENIDGVDLITPETCEYAPGQRLAFNKLDEGVADGIIQYQIVGNEVQKKIGNSDWQPLSLDNIEVLKLTFTTSEALSNGQIPLITIHLEATVDEGRPEETSYNVQTSVHPRFPKYVKPTP